MTARNRDAPRRAVGAVRARQRLFGASALLVAVSLGLLTACDMPAPPMSADDLKRCEVAVLGDSLTVGVQPYLPAALDAKGCTLRWIDGKGGRKTGEGVALLAERALHDDIPSVLIVGLGTNDRFELAAFRSRVDSIMAIANGRHVIWIDSAHRPIRDTTNTILAERAGQYPNLTVTSWNAPYWENPSWRSTDNVHATPAGYQARATLMAESAERVVK